MADNSVPAPRRPGGAATRRSVRRLVGLGCRERWPHGGRIRLGRDRGRAARRHLPTELPARKTPARSEAVVLASPSGPGREQAQARLPALADQAATRASRVTRDARGWLQSRGRDAVASRSRAVSSKDRGSSAGFQVREDGGVRQSLAQCGFDLLDEVVAGAAPSRRRRQHVKRHEAAPAGASAAQRVEADAVALELRQHFVDLACRQDHRTVRAASTRSAVPTATTAGRDAAGSRRNRDHQLVLPATRSAARGRHPVVHEHGVLAYPRLSIDSTGRGKIQRRSWHPRLIHTVGLGHRRPGSSSSCPRVATPQVNGLRPAWAQDRSRWRARRVHAANPLKALV